jgi:hypothetical protein
MATSVLLLSLAGTSVEGEPPSDEPFSIAVRVILFHVFSIVAAGLTLVGTSCYIYTYFFIQRPHTHSGIHRLIFFLVVSDWFISLFWIIENVVLWLVHGNSTDHTYPGRKDNDFLCMGLGPIQLFFMFSSLFWTGSYATEMLLRIKSSGVDSFGRPSLYTNFPRWREIIYHTVSWGSPILLLIDPIVETSLGRYKIGDNGVTCLYFDTAKTVVWIIFGVVVVVLSYCLITYLILLVLFYSKYGVNYLSLSSVGTSQLRTIGKQVSLYLLAFILCWMWLIILIIIHGTGHAIGKLPFAFAYLVTFFLPLNGFVNSLLYGFSATIREDVRVYFKRKVHQFKRRCCSCCTRNAGWEELEEEEEVVADPTADYLGTMTNGDEEERNIYSVN